MKIGFFSDSYKPYMSGVVKSIELFSSEMVKKNNQVYIFAPDYPEAEKKDNIFRFKSLPAPTNPGFRLALPVSNRVVEKVEELELDVIHTHSPFLMGWLGRFVARKLNIPLVFTYHTLYEEYAHYAPLAKGLTKKLAIKYSKDYCQACDMVVAPSKYVEKILRDYGITTKIMTVSTGINIKPYRKKDGSWVRDKYGIGQEEKVLLFVGRLGQEKNASFLIEAFKQVCDSLSCVRLIMVGDGPEKDKLQQKVDSFSLHNQVIFAGKQRPEKVVDYYLASDLFVFPSTTETQGLVTLEAMAGGLPVVAVDAAGSSVMVDDGLNGILVKLDTHLFARGVIDLLTHDMRYNLFQKNALKKAEEYAIDRMADKLLDGYKEIINATEEGYTENLA